MIKIAYLILAHENPNHLKRLIRALDSPDSAFFVSVDKRGALNDFLMPGAANVYVENVYVERDPLPIYADEFSVVEATIRLMRAATQAEAPYDYLILSRNSAISACFFLMEGCAASWRDC